LKGNSEETECASEHREVPKEEEAAVMPVWGPRKRRRDRNLTAVRRRKPKGRIQASCESRNRLTVAGRRRTRCAWVAWLRRGVARKDCTRAKLEGGTQRVRPLKKNLRTHHEGKRGTKDLGSKRSLYVRKKRATAISIWGWSSRQLSRLGRGGPTYKTLKKTLELEFVKRANGMCSGFRKWGNGPCGEVRGVKIQLITSDTKCTMLGLLDQFWPPIVPCYATEDTVRIGNWFIYNPHT
jgi:hypothetical protein